MTTEPSLEGWVPAAEVPLADVIDHAFDYRGNVTVDLRDGRELTGYLFNRDARAREPFVQMFDSAGEGISEAATDFIGAKDVALQIDGGGRVVDETKHGVEGRWTVAQD